VVYSYLDVNEFIKVATLSKQERETVLSSKIIKKNRKYHYEYCKLPCGFFEKFTSDVALKGLLIAIQLSPLLKMDFKCANKKDEERFKNVFPSLIAAALRAGT
jgi:hypothetical protein